MTIRNAYARSTDPATSWIAAEGLDVDMLSEVKKAILTVLATRSDLTHIEIDREVRALFPDRQFAQSTIRSRVRDLQDANLVHCTGITLLPGSRRLMNTYSLAPHLQKDMTHEN